MVFASYCSETFGKRASFRDSRMEGEAFVRFLPFFAGAEFTSFLEFLDLIEFLPRGIDVRTSDPSDS